MADITDGTLLDEGIISREDIERMQNEIDAIIDDAVEWAENEPLPDAGELTRDVYSEE